MNENNCIVCEKPKYISFNEIIKNELKNQVTIDELINDSYCVVFPLDYTSEYEIDEEMLDTNDLLSSIKGKTGVYHLWIDEDYCVDHSTRKMLCVYAGKGVVDKRVKSHIKEKWTEVDERLILTFYECENRIAKYIEQLFLDLYSFHLNSEENKGKEYLKTIWDEERYINGSDIMGQSIKLTKKYPERFQ